jgi:hypothetical protein
LFDVKIFLLLLQPLLLLLLLLLLLPRHLDSPGACFAYLDLPLQID